MQQNTDISAGTENEFGGISGFTHPVATSPMAKLRLPGHPGIMATLPDESRYGEKEVKKSCLRRKQWENEEEEEEEFNRLPWLGQSGRAAAGCACTAAALRC